MSKYRFLTYDPFDIKKVLNIFREEFNLINSEVLVNNLIYIIKNAIFYNIVIKDSNIKDQRYFNSIIYDSLNAVISIHKSNERYFYFDFRSLIENSLRVILQLEDNDKTSVTDLFYKFQELELGNYQLIKNYYSKACDFVHNNIKAGLPVTSSYIELKENHLTEEKMLPISKELVNLISEITYMILIVYEDEVNHVFYRKKSSLRLLISSKIYERAVKKRVG